MQTPHKLTENFDLVVVGAGAAGLWTALEAAGQGALVALVSRSPISQSASFWAQGGLAAALTSADSPQQHLEDTLKAGRDTVYLEAAKVLTEETPAIITDLEALGVPFDRDKTGALELGLEGGHSRQRIVHAGGSATGRHLTAQLAKVVKTKEQIKTFEGVEVQKLWLTDERCIGVLTDHLCIAAKATILTTGGSAALWARSTNPPSATGLGLYLAYEAGAALADLEFVQFHPTALVRDGSGKYDGFLISEAVRGEGAKLLNADGERFVDELAPRDQVARAILREVAGQPVKSVDLDMRQIPRQRFPNIDAVLKEIGLDMRAKPVPVYPAAHYMIGGIATDLEGKTNVTALYAAGECACTGLHGANRLASNSLSECFVFGRRAALSAVESDQLSKKLPPLPNVAVLPQVDQLSRDELWQYAGLERSATGLKQITSQHPLVRLIAKAALNRRESRGTHFRSDYPETNRELDGEHLLLSKSSGPLMQKW